MSLQIVTLTLMPEEAQTYLLPEVTPLDDVISFRLEVVEIIGSTAANLDVEILGCLKGTGQWIL